MSFSSYDKLPMSEKIKFQAEASSKQAEFNRRMRQQELQKLQDDVLKRSIRDAPALQAEQSRRRALLESSRKDVKRLENIIGNAYEDYDRLGPVRSSMDEQEKNSRLDFLDSIEKEQKKLEKHLMTIQDLGYVGSSKYALGGR